MARIRKVDTKPELIVRRLAHDLGYRYRLHRRDLPGTPDLVFPRLRKIILVHGCFWHRHDCRDGRKVPNSKPEYWAAKFARNVGSDEHTRLALDAKGWRVMVLWECELRDKAVVRRQIEEFLGDWSEYQNAHPGGQRAVERRTFNSNRASIPL